MSVRLDKPNFPRPAAIALAMAAFLLPALPARADFTFTRIITDTPQGGLPVLSAPSINNFGTVVYVDSGSANSGIFTRTAGGVVTTIDNTSSLNGYGVSGDPLFTPAINDSGTVAAWVRIRSEGGANRIITGNGGAETTIVDATSPPVGGASGAILGGSPTIASNGTVAFVAAHNGGFTGNGVFTGSGGALTTLSTANTVGQPVDPSISPDGTYLAFSPSGTNATALKSISLLHNGVTTPNALTTSGFFQNVAVNNHGQVIASAPNGSGGAGIYLSDGTLISASNSPFNDFDAVAINGLGSYVFRASGGTFNGIFTGPSQSTRVIESGDALDGSTVTSVSIGHGAINDAGQVAFYAKLADGRQGIYVANGVPVPEPASVALLVVGGAVLMASARRRSGSVA